MRRVALAAIVLCSLPGSSLPVSGAEGLLGYYRQAALHGDTIVFNAESDLWKVPIEGK